MEHSYAASARLECSVQKSPCGLNRAPTPAPLLWFQ